MADRKSRALRVPMLCRRAPLLFRCLPELAENRALPPALALLRAVVPACERRIRGIQKLSNSKSDGESHIASDNNIPGPHLPVRNQSIGHIRIVPGETL